MCKSPAKPILLALYKYILPCPVALCLGTKEICSIGRFSFKSNSTYH